jgi:hypothetical protein
MIDIVIPEYLRGYFSENMREIVFGFILCQIAVAYVYVFLATRKKSHLADYEFNGNGYFEGIRFSCNTIWDYLSLFLFILMLCLFGWLLFDNAELCWPDQSHITSGGMLGELWMQIVPQTGRFSPMLHQEFLIFGKIFESAWAFYSIAFVELLLFCILMLIALPVQSLSLRLLLISALTFSFGFLAANSALICPEVHIVMGFLAFIYFAYLTKQNRAGNYKYYFGAGGQIFLAAYLIYLKEPVFLVFGSYSLLMIISEISNFQNFEDAPLFKKILVALQKCPVEFSMFCLSMIYAGVYFLYIFMQIQDRYGSSPNSTILSVFFASIHGNYLVSIFLILVLVKILLYSKYHSNKVLDFLAFSFVFYYVSLIILGMKHPYYYVPIAFMGIVLVADFLQKISAKPSASLFAASICLLLVAIEFPKSISYFQRRELYMISRKLTSHTINSYLIASHGMKPSKIFFLEENEGYDTSQFVSYLNYSLGGPATFQMIQENHKKPNSISVIPISHEELTKLKRVSAGAVFIGLPNLGGGNVKNDQIQIPDLNTVDEIVPWNHVSSWKKKIYSVASKPNPQIAFQGIFISK